MAQGNKIENADVYQHIYSSLILVKYQSNLMYKGKQMALDQPATNKEVSVNSYLLHIPMYSNLSI
jgi:hypothetical protein